MHHLRIYFIKPFPLLNQAFEFKDEVRVSQANLGAQGRALKIQMPDLKSGNGFLGCISARYNIYKLFCNIGLPCTIIN